LLRIPVENWSRWALLGIALLALFSALASTRTAANSTKAQLASIRETTAWANFQTKSLKQHVCEMERDLIQAMMLEADNPESRGYLDPKLDSCLKDIERFEREKGEVRTHAEQAQKAQELHRRRAGSFGLAVLLFQTAILLSALAVGMDRRMVWLAGLAVAAGGVLVLANGFFLVL
jgi:hypothetical protein